MRPVSQKLAWGVTLILPLSIVWGCAQDLRSASSRSKLEHSVPKDPWPNQKEGYCCFVYNDPLPEKPAAVAMTQSELSRELEDTKATLAARDRQIAKLRQQLQSAQSTNAALERDKASLTKQVDVMSADRVELATQLEAARRDLAATAALGGAMGAGLAGAQKGAVDLNAAQAEQSLRLTQDTQKLEQERQFLASQTALQSANAQANQQLAAAQAELASTEAMLKDKDELAKKLEESRVILAQQAAREAELESSIKSMERALKSESAQTFGKIRRSGDSFTVEFTDRILFDSGSAKVSPKGMKVIQRVADSLKEGGRKIVQIDGHTDDVPIRKSPAPRFLSNWELSAARAGNVAQYLQQGGITPQQLAAVGYSDTRPHVPNEDKASRALNRRVEIIVMPAPSPQAMLRRDE